MKAMEPAETALMERLERKWAETFEWKRVGISVISVGGLCLRLAAGS